MLEAMEALDTTLQSPCLPAQIAPSSEASSAPNSARSRSSRARAADWSELQQCVVLLRNLLDLAKAHEEHIDGLVRFAQSQKMQTMLDGIVTEVSRNVYHHL